ncbi:MAG: MBOAT family protein [Syntrophomonadaceae bacterium]|nr:MBOAT family protein [Syntrophomonadaceae bacterium]
MLNTWIFMAFVITCWLLYWLVVPVRLRPLFLALASFAYFAYYYPRDMLFLLALAVMVYVAGVAVSREPPGRKRLLAGMVVILAAILGYFKYSAFMAEILNLLLQPLTASRLSVPEILVPLGISYFTFKMIHYLVDIGKGNIPRHHLVDFLNYIFFFPILVSGPIERFQPFLTQTGALRGSGGDNQGIVQTEKKGLQNEPAGNYRSAPERVPESASAPGNHNQPSSGLFQLLRRRGFNADDVYAGLPRIISGLFKKVVLADSLAATAMLLQQPDLTAGQYWLASFAFTFQLYFDFSGYSDLAIGIARLFGYRIMENFNWPYLARNVSDFWKRWHMSLTGWFRDYIFIPLGGSRGTLGVTIRNTLIVMAVTGLWHGAGWHFVLWGLYHALGLIALRLYRRYLLPGLSQRVSFLESKPANVLSILLTFNFVNIGWIFFACDTGQSIYVLTRMFG